MHKPTNWTVHQAERLLLYLMSTPEDGPVYSSQVQENLEAYVDASWLSEGEKGTDSRAGYCLRLAPRDQGGPSASYIVFSKVMKKICLSTEHAEMMALSECIREIVRQRQFLHELGAPQHDPTFVGEDNSGTVTYAHSEKLSDRSKHVHALMRHIKEEQRDRIIDVVKGAHQESMG
jgi:hypothetical protein